jgi:VWFA-related protein
MHNHTRPSLIFLALALSSTAVLAQQTAPPSQPASRSMVLDVVVTPKSGPPVSGLQQKDFTILDNKSAVPITGFTAAGGPEAPVEVVVVLDTVNASTENLSVERAEVDKFFKANGGHLPYPTFLAIFQGQGIAMGESPTRNGNLLSAALAQTNLGSGVQLKDTGASNDADRAQRSMVAAERLVAKEAAVPGRKVLIWVSPGWPLVSSPSYNYDDKQQQELFRRAVAMTTLVRRANVTFYIVKPGGTDEGVHQFDYEVYVKGAAKPIQAVPADTSLQVLSIQSGGLFLTGSNDLAGQLQRCMADFTSYYELSFDPPADDHPNDLHTLQVKVSQPGLTARTRTVYYSQP